MKKIFLLIVSVLLSTCSIDKPVEDDWEQSLTVPRPFANPKNADEYFFNYRLAHFEPRTEPFIKETFGNELSLDPTGFWEHPSYTSFVVGFATNLPAISAIEYGETTSYGQMTETSDSYYYLHLHYIRDLKPGVPYHYRIRVQDYDGIEIASGDYTFTLSGIPANAIRIPEDMQGAPPYHLTEGNTLYVLTRDLTVPTLAINIKAHNVTLDLDGHTIIYDNDHPKVIGGSWPDYAYNEEATFGIRAGLWNFTNAKIYNGVVKQGKNGGMGFIGVGFNPVFLNHMGTGSQNEIAGVTVDFYGNSVGGMVAGDGKVHHNVIIDRGTVIDNRHQGIKALDTGNSTTNEVSWNSIRRFRQQGIYSSGAIHHNELYSDSFDTNSFLIGPREGASVANNKLFGMGYNPHGIGWANNLIVRENFIYLRGYAPTLRSTEYDRKSAISGLRTTNYDNTNYSNMLYVDNVIVLKAEDGCTQARGIWTTNATNDRQLIYRRNTVKVEAMPGNITSDDDNFYNGNVNNAVTALTLSGSDDELLPGSANTPQPIIFEDNRFIGNVNLITLGEGYGIASSVWMYRTKFEKLDHDNEYFRPVRLGFWYWNTLNNRLIDTETVNISADEMTPHFYGNEGYMEISYGQSHDLTLTAARNQPLRNTTVNISIDGTRTFNETTNNNGILHFDLLTVQHLKNQSVSKNEYRQYTFTVAGYTPRTFTVSQLKTTASIAF